MFKKKTVNKEVPEPVAVEPAAGPIEEVDSTELIDHRPVPEVSDRERMNQPPVDDDRERSRRGIA